MTWELDHRSNDGIEVGLWWDSESDRLTVSVVDLRGAEMFELEVGGADPLDVFQHPYAYARSAERLGWRFQTDAARRRAS